MHIDGADQTYRHEVAKLAKDAFHIFLEDTVEARAAEQNRVLGEVSVHGNPGGYLPALTDLACEKLQEDIQAFARIHTAEFTKFGLPCDARVESELELAAKQMAGGTFSRIHGQLDLIEGRTKRHLAIPAGSTYITTAIAASTNMALRKSKISLRRQRIKMNFARSRNPADFPVRLPHGNQLNQERIMGLFPGQEYPKSMYHATKPPVIVHSRSEQVALGSEWSEKYIPQEYPKHKYGWNERTRIVKNAGEEAALGVGWADSPATFQPYLSPRSTKAAQQDPGG